MATALIEQAKDRLAKASAAWPERIAASFLSDEMKERYLALLTERRERLGL